MSIGVGFVLKKWHDPEDFGTATGPTAVQGYNGRAESFGPMPAPDPQQSCRSSTICAATSWVDRNVA
jgi:hypothetical protein